MKILFKVLKLYKKEGEYYPCNVEFGTCSDCDLQLDEEMTAYMLDASDAKLYCETCYERRMKHGHKRTSPSS